jgi:hypothetical protein
VKLLLDSGGKVVLIDLGPARDFQQFAAVPLDPDNGAGKKNSTKFARPERSFSTAPVKLMTLLIKLFSWNIGSIATSL